MTFYVDKILNNGDFAFADSEANIAYNNSLLGKRHVDNLTNTLIEHNEVSAIGYVGRYLYCCEVSLEKTISRITFIDCKKDVKLAMDMAEKFMKTNEDLAKQFIAIFAKQSAVYDKEYYKATIVIGQAPA